MMESRRRSRRRTAGFTLLEALAATVLMAAILSALATVTAQWLPNWNRGFARVQRTELLDVALERLVADIAAAEFVSPNRKTTRPLFEGAELAVTFVRTALRLNASSGLEIVRIAEAADRGGPALIRARAPFAPIATGASPTNFSDPVVLLRAPYRVSFSYAGQDRVWKSTWLGARELPSAVRVSIRDAATERTLAVSTAIAVHVQLPAECASKKEGRGCGKTARNETTSAGDGLAGSNSSGDR
jgi:general secretion pathway protein J